MLCNDLERWDGGGVGGKLKCEGIYAYLGSKSHKSFCIPRVIIGKESMYLQTWDRGKDDNPFPSFPYPLFQIFVLGQSYLP